MNSGGSMAQDLRLVLPQLIVLLTAMLALVAEMLRWRRAGLGCVAVGLGAATVVSAGQLDRKSVV